jgi:hypothetical protein
MGTLLQNKGPSLVEVSKIYTLLVEIIKQEKCN